MSGSMVWLKDRKRELTRLGFMKYEVLGDMVQGSSTAHVSVINIAYKE